MIRRHTVLLAALAWIVTSCSGSGVAGPTEPVPTFVRVLPSGTQVAIERGQSVVFEVQAEGPNGEPAQIQFRVNQLIAASTSSYVFNPPDTGHYQIEAVATIGQRSATYRWTVIVTMPANLPPSLQVTTNTLSGDAPLALTANVTGEDTDGMVVLLAIDFNNDGTPEQTAAGNTMTAQYTYQAEGSYTIRVTATDDGGASSTLTRQVTVLPHNAEPVGTLTSDVQMGDAPLEVILTPAGSDPDGAIAKVEIDPDLDGFDWIDITNGGVLPVQYAFRGTPYQPRLRLTDDHGAQTIIDGPAITVFRPIDVQASTFTAQGNAFLAGFAAYGRASMWADNRDKIHFSYTIRDKSGAVMPFVPVRVTLLRPALLAPDGTSLEPTTTVSLNTNMTNANGIVSGDITANAASRGATEQDLGVIYTFALRAEADAGHGTWRRLVDVDALTSETIVSTEPLAGKLEVSPANACKGEVRTIRIQAVQRREVQFGAPAAGLFTHVRYMDKSLPDDLRPTSGNWRTGSDGWITMTAKPTRVGAWAIRAWVDGQPLNVTAFLSVLDC